MRKLFINHPIRSGAAILFLLYLAFYFFTEFWVFRTFPYQEDVEVLRLNTSARHTVNTLLKPDSFFYNILAGLRENKPHPDIVLLDVDYDIWQEAGTWPLPRKVYADIFSKLYEYQPRLLVLDYLYPNPQTPWVLETLGREFHNVAPEVASRITRKLDHDGMLRRALAQLDYVMIYNFVNANEYLDPAERKKILGNLGYQVGRAPSVSVDGNGEEKFFPYERVKGARQSILPFQFRAKGQGFAWVIPDRFGTMGKIPLLHRLVSTDQTARSYYLPHVALETLRVLENADGYRLQLNDGKVETVSVGHHEFPTNRYGEILINFYGSSPGSRKLPYVRSFDLLKDKVPVAKLRDKIVVMGTTARFTTDDFHYTPAGKLWGTEIVGYAISSLMQHDYLQRPAWLRVAEPSLLAAMFLLAITMMMQLKPLPNIILVMSMLLGLSVLAGVLYVVKGIQLSVIIPGSFLFLLYLQTSIFRYILDERQKRLYKNALGLYLSPQLTEQVAENPALLSLDGKEENLSVLFSDIRDFTTISEGMKAEELTQFLHQYLSPMTDIVFDTDGTLDKYIGDAIMAFWGAPIHHADHPRRAVDAGLRMLNKLDELRDRWQNEGLPPIQIGIGINTGLMRVGNMGSDRRLSYTVMGDNVNLASRLEGLTKQYGVRLIVSESTYLAVREAYYGRELDRVQVKGKQQAVSIYEIMGRWSPDEKLAKDLANWQNAQTLYCNRQWDEAERVFRHWCDTYHDATAAAYLEDIEAFRKKPPPADWQGVSIKTSK